MRERLPVRAIFNKVLAADRPLPMTLPGLVNHPAMAGLAISQFELRGDGWGLRSAKIRPANRTQAVRAGFRMVRSTALGSTDSWGGVAKNLRKKPTSNPAWQGH